MPNIGPMELIIVLVIVLLVVGPKKLPGLGKSLGTGMREFKDSVSGNNKHDDEEDDLLKRRDVPPAIPGPPVEPAKPAVPVDPAAPRQRDAE